MCNLPWRFVLQCFFSSKKSNENGHVSLLLSFFIPVRYISHFLHSNQSCTSHSLTMPLCLFQSISLCIVSNFFSSLSFYFDDSPSFIKYTLYFSFFIRLFRYSLVSLLRAFWYDLYVFTNFELRAENISKKFILCW